MTERRTRLSNTEEKRAKKAVSSDVQAFLDNGGVITKHTAMESADAVKDYLKARNKNKS